MPSDSAEWSNELGMYGRHVKSSLFLKSEMGMSGCAVGIWGEYDSNDLLGLVIVRVVVRVAGFKTGAFATRPERTVMGLLN
jgi:hypothetical protein